jgi:hypothetical protein
MTSTEDSPAALLAPYYRRHQDTVVVSAQQGSGFAKDIAGDHNPIHDVDAPRFCVPGDLLFALIVDHYGLARHMTLTFRGMLRADTPLRFPTAPEAAFSIADAAGRDYVGVELGPRMPAPPAVQRGVIEAYVACSGQTFPDLLQPLLEVYDSMALAFDRPLTAPPSLSLTQTHLEVSGKRGDARFDFDILEDGQQIGRCWKKMVVSGLRAYSSADMGAVVARYQARRAAAGV